jgi:hypothetical protein
MTSPDVIFRTSRPEVNYDDVPCESLLSPVEGGDSYSGVCVCICVCVSARMCAYMCVCVHLQMHVCEKIMYVINVSPVVCQIASMRTFRGKWTIMAPTTAGAAVSLRAMMSSQTAGPKSRPCMAHSSSKIGRALILRAMMSSQTAGPKSRPCMAHSSSKIGRALILYTQLLLQSLYFFVCVIQTLILYITWCYNYLMTPNVSIVVC